MKRRTMLGLLGALAGALVPGATPSAAGAAPRRVPRELVQRLQELLRRGDAIRIIGNAYRWHLQRRRSQEDLARVLVSVGHPAQVVDLTKRDLRRVVRDRIEEDFAAVRLVPIGGWLLAEAEGQLCALSVSSPPVTEPRRGA